MAIFVNIHGQPIDIKAASAAATKKPKAAGKDEYHKGWRAVGFSPEKLAAAKAAHEQDIRNAAASGGSAPPPWSEEAYMRQTRPQKIRSKPYELRQAAIECAELAEKSGWKNCRAEPVAKGGV